MRVGVKAAWIGGTCLILASIITAVISKMNNKGKVPTVNKIDNSVKNENNYNNSFNKVINNSTLKNTTIYKIDTIKSKLTKVDSFFVIAKKPPAVLYWNNFSFMPSGTFAADEYDPFTKNTKQITGRWNFNKEETEISMFSNEETNEVFTLKNLIIKDTFFQFDFFYNNYVFRRGFKKS